MKYCEGLKSDFFLILVNSILTMGFAETPIQSNSEFTAEDPNIPQNNY